jgi:hypothetical protein
MFDTRLSPAMKPIYILGDHHGDYEGVFSVLSERGIRDATVIHVGDGAEGFPDWRARTAESLDKRFAALGIQYLSIRGNHSDPAFFDGRVMLPNFKLLRDYTTLHLNGQSWLLVGGGISIDRLHRVPERSWWPSEAFELREDLAQPADVLVTHSGPEWIGPGCRNELVRACANAEAEFGCDTLIAELLAERRAHEKLFRLVKPKTWYLGHFHERAEKPYLGCRTRILDCNELMLHQTS